MFSSDSKVARSLVLSYADIHVCGISYSGELLLINDLLLVSHIVLQLNQLASGDGSKQQFGAVQSCMLHGYFDAVIMNLYHSSHSFYFLCLMGIKKWLLVCILNFTFTSYISDF